eukprot:TRINITY_DN8127_c0_g1_i3.p1 TRINITY_DN8127_c0_g1~~TRINITY_DN8127_c0_g1_i3.p1  ORF type:complete len:399 (-),score=89.96 TRINITY_DN8127_c0_g1_i3:259-1455(-)
MMDSEEMNTLAKASKAVSSQAQSPTNNTMAYADWPSTLKAYYNPGKSSLPPGYFPSAPASSPQAHAYLWGPQHMISPYGTPAPYVPVYSPGAMYTHPSLTTGTLPYNSFGGTSGSVDDITTGAVAASTEGEGKSSDKDQNPPDNSKVFPSSHSILPGKAHKTPKGSTRDGAFSQSVEGATEGSSDGSIEKSNDSQSRHKSCFEKGSAEVDVSQSSTGMITYTSQNTHAQGIVGARTASTNSNSAAPMMPASLPVASGISGPVTNLNIGMDFWSGTPVTPTSTARAKLPIASSSTAIVPQNMPADERELKRQRRKQSNRESARRSRLRKQAECEELQRQVGRLKEENEILRTELNHLREQCEQLSSENNSLTEQLHTLRRDEGGESGIKAGQQLAESEH